ncbi:response regulator [Rhodovulum euryhalinum]|uniref:Regulatory protein VirG n=1 Tax=Rhodovulum euryhalinum TaxID=35805 RepID=A0A4R2KBF4_9RHOB|nr:response regulator [Rhodovulum euryhalinum]TCO69377.1 two-component system phosphate regulon response regulator OmpR [Rhodovulum euryhalinum]
MAEPQLPSVLIVDDDQELCDLLQTYLETNGFRARSAGDAAGMRAAVAARWPDALVLDLMLPGEDGLSILRQIRAERDVPVLMLSARGEDMDRIIGLEVGADDYMAKPFNPRELLARLRALLRRQTGPQTAGGTEFRFGPFRLDVAARLLWRGPDELALTTAEYDLLEAFVRHPNRVLTRDTLIDLIQGHDRDPFDRSIDNRVTRLRRKIEADAGAPHYIRTVRGSGYLFNPAGDRS